jgi:sugar phosphate isomerase/epimerase
LRPKIGISLPYQYLSGDYGFPAAELFCEALGPVDIGLASLGGENIKCIELSLFGLEAPREQILAAVKNVWQTGLQVSLHPTLPDVRKNGGMNVQYPWLEGILRELPDFQRELVFTVHARSSEQGKLKDYRDQTVRVLKSLAVEVENREYPIRFALEVNRSKGKIDPSTTYAGVLDICGEIDSSRVGICWDWGHVQANVIKCGLSPEPPAEFLRRVVNTHVHEIGPDGKTHWPLSGPSDAIKRSVVKLKSVRYSGYLILELHPRRYANRLDLKKAVQISVGCLAEANRSVYGRTRYESRSTNEEIV